MKALLCALFGLAAAEVANAQPGSPAGPVPVERLTARRRALAQRVGTGIVVLRSADERDQDGREVSQDSDFRQDNDFFYLTGIETPHSWLVIVARDSQPVQELLFIPPRDTLGERWTGPKLVPGPQATALTGVAEVRPNDDVERELRRLVLPGNSPARRGALWFKRTNNERKHRFFSDILFEAQGVRIGDLGEHLGAQRLIKDADEIARMRKAAEISADGHMASWRVSRPGILEREYEAEAEAAFRRLGAERLAYPSIVGAGINATTLHYDENRGAAAAGDLVVMDMGAEYGYYAADVTRTIPVTGKFSDRQRALYDLVYGAQQAAIDSVRPGVTIGRLNQIAREYMRRNSGSLCGGESCDQYMPHSLSHWLGMDVHDVGAYNVVLAPGMVFSVEPGIYIPAEKLGVRIEDDVLVTPTGSEILSRKAPRTSREVEQYMQQNRRAVQP